MKYCAVCLITKNDNYYLCEWAEYHLRIGFDSVIVYDNGSDTPVAETLGYLVEIGRAHVHQWEIPFAEDGQGRAYTDCMKRYRNEFKWIAVIDSDEFIFPRKTTSIKRFLAEFECYGGVVAHWLNSAAGACKRAATTARFSRSRTPRPN